MKVGILTWYFGNNYGAKAHSYALQHVLKDMDIDAVHIAYYPKGMWKTNIRMNLNTPHMKFHPCILAKCLLRCAKFMSWTKKQYTVTEKVHSAKEIDELGFDAIIIGSDEVFNYNHPFFDEIYYGKGLKTPLITYAPSSGQASCDKVFDETIRESLSKFVSFSARDNHTKQLIRNNVDKEVTEVLDPTLLYNFDFENDPFANSEPYLLIYSFDPWDNYKKQIIEFARSKRLKVICVGRHSKWADKSYTSASEYEWLSSFKHAECVFTDSFHGVVFSVINKKQFMIVSRKDKINKINDLLSAIGVKRDFYNGQCSFDEYYADALNYNEISESVAKQRDLSLDYLKNSLEEACK